MAPEVEPFASVDELEAGWHPLLDSERARAGVLLARATRLIRAQCPGWHTAEQTNPGICADVCCAMVQRAMASPGIDVPDGVKQMSQTTGSFQDTYTFDSAPTCAAPWCSGPWPHRASTCRTVSSR